MKTALWELRAAGTRFNAAAKMAVSKTVCCRLGDRDRGGIQNMVSVFRTTDTYCEDGVKELNRTSHFIGRMKIYDVG